jgi:hypothetical protein
MYGCFDKISMQRGARGYSKLLKEICISDLQLGEAINSGLFFSVQHGKLKTQSGPKDIAIVHPQQGNWILASHECFDKDLFRFLQTLPILSWRQSFSEVRLQLEGS